MAAKVHPSPGQTGADLARLLDELDQRLRLELPEIGEVFIDVTAHRRRAGACKAHAEAVSLATTG